MDTDIEEHLARELRAEVAGVTLTGDVLDRATRRHHRRTVLHRSAYATGVAALVGVLAVALGVGGAGGRAGGADRPGVEAGGPPSGQVTSPELQLAAAAEASSDISYRFTITGGVRPDGPTFLPLAGAFDPRTDTGYVDTAREGDHLFRERLIDGVMYLGSTGSDRWRQYPKRYENLLLSLPPIGKGPQVDSADLNVLLKALRQAGAKVTRTGPDTYRFEIDLSDPARPQVTGRLAGDVTLDAEKRIAKLTYDRTDVLKLKDRTIRTTIWVTFELSDYGLPVTVERPTNVVTFPRQR